MSSSASTDMSARQAAEETQQLLRGDWVIAVITALSAGRRRFAEIQADINSVEETVGRRRHESAVSNSVLSRTLARMNDDGLLTREELPGHPTSITWYELTSAGYDLIPVLKAMAHWALRHRPSDT